MVKDGIIKVSDYSTDILRKKKKKRKKWEGEQHKAIPVLQGIADEVVASAA